MKLLIDEAGFRKVAVALGQKEMDYWPECRQSCHENYDKCNGHSHCIRDTETDVNIGPGSLFRSVVFPSLSVP